MSVYIVGGMPDNRVRVWKEVHHVYREVAKRHGLTIADTISILLFYTPVLAPYLVAFALRDNYDDMDWDEAMEIALELRDRIESFCRIAYEAKEGVKRA